MRVEPATVDQIRRANDGRMVAISSDVGGVAQDLKRIDPHLKVRFAEAGHPPFWAVYYETPDGRSTYLVTTCEAWQNHAGVWEGLDQRLVKRIQEIDPHNGYDYAAELDKQNQRAEQAKREQFREKVGGTTEEAAWAVRKDLGSKKRAFIGKKA